MKIIKMILYIPTILLLLFIFCLGQILDIIDNIIRAEWVDEWTTFILGNDYK